VNLKNTEHSGDMVFAIGD